MKKHDARKAAMQLIFEQLFGGDGEPEKLVDLINYTPDEEEMRYITSVVTGVASKAGELDKLISSCLVGWKLDRISKVDHAIMRLAVYEFMYTGLAPAVAINEAIELAREFSSEKSCRFINGVLGSINRKRASE